MKWCIPTIARENFLPCECSFRLHQTLCFQLLEPPSVITFTWHSLSFDRRSITVFYLGRAAGVGDVFPSLSPHLSRSSLSLLNLAGDRFPSWGKVFRWLMLRTAESTVLPSVLAPKHCWQDPKNCSLRTDEAAGRRTGVECAARSRKKTKQQHKQLGLWYIFKVWTFYCTFVYLLILLHLYLLGYVRVLLVVHVRISVQDLHH